jgi:hypothetical protein
MVGRTELAADSGAPAAWLGGRISITCALNSTTVFHVIKTGRKVAAAGALTLLFAVWAPLNAFACGTTTPSGGGSASGAGSAAGGGTAIATGGGSAIATGGGQLNSVGSIGFDWTTFAALGGFVILVAAAVLAILLVTTLRRPRPDWALMAQLSPDGRYWWDGRSWHDGLLNPPPPSVRSADGARWWDGRSWRLVPTN